MRARSLKKERTCCTYTCANWIILPKSPDRDTPFCGQCWFGSSVSRLYVLIFTPLPRWIIFESSFDLRCIPGSGTMRRHESRHYEESGAMCFGKPASVTQKMPRGGLVGFQVFEKQPEEDLVKKRNELAVTKSKDQSTTKFNFAPGASLSLL